ncbi:MAG: NADH-quinone oxidoreductase subunit N, partial [Anaerolineales bacterium]|nr:NADH-quinone oxidoreductase subunit N [Anaerolineales bacterium]
MEFTIPEINLIMILPVVIVLVTGILILVFDLVLKQERKNLLSWLSLAGMFVALVQAGSAWGQDYATFIPEGGHAMIVGDNYSHFLNIIFLLTGIITILISNHYIEEGRVEAKGEYYMLLLFSISGMMLMGMANDLILVFVALEMLSIPLYILCAFARPRLESEESAMKYFLLGAFSSGFLVFGIALIYGATGATALPDVLAGLSGVSGLGLAGVALLLVVFGFKVAVVPFHSWTPDVYEGAPTVVTAFMSVGAKVGGFAAMMRVFMAAFPNVSDTWIPVLAVLSALTMIVGNVAALGQQNIKRMLAYS